MLVEAHISADPNLTATYQGFRVDFNNRRSSVEFNVLLFDCATVFHDLYLLSGAVRGDITAFCSTGWRDKHHARFRVKCLGNLTSDLDISSVVSEQILTPYMGRPIRGSTSATLRIVSTCFFRSICLGGMTLRWDIPILLSKQGF